MEEEKSDAYERISPTAWIVARQRTFTDIPYSQEVFDELQAIMRTTRSTEEMEKLESLIEPEITPFMEARVKLVNRVLKEKNVKQVLEIAAGFSSRGMEMTKNASINFIEVDLPGIMNEKRGILKALVEQSKISPRPNLYFYDGNALNQGDLLTATKVFKKEPIAVVNEGLLTYLDFEEKANVAGNIHWLLESFGGVWVTPDLSLWSGGKAQAVNNRVAHITGIDKQKISFESEAKAREFFEGLGFAVESHSFREVLDELSSPQKLNLPRERVIEILGARAVFVMTLRP
jgi:O-methyltransferase involved in polyketide biosynthesis